MSTRFLVHRWNSALAVIALVVSGAAHAGAPASPAESSWCAPRCDQLVIDWNHTCASGLRRRERPRRSAGRVAHDGDDASGDARRRQCSAATLRSLCPARTRGRCRRRGGGGNRGTRRVAGASSQASRSAEGAMAERSAGSRQGRCSRIRQIARCTRRTGNPRAARRRRQQRQTSPTRREPAPANTATRPASSSSPCPTGATCSRSACAIPRSSAWPRHRRSIAPPTPAPSRK